jgi:hypothetical protein
MFVVQRELLAGAPQPLEPQDGAAVPLAAGGAQVPFRWAPLAGASEYVIEISRRPDFAPLLFTDRLARTSYTWSQSTTGTYYWRLRATEADGRATVYGGPRSFVIR